MIHDARERREADAALAEAVTRAGELARSVDGVKAVRNDLEIRQK